MNWSSGSLSKVGHWFGRNPPFPANHKRVCLSTADLSGEKTHCLTRRDKKSDPLWKEGIGTTVGFREPWKSQNIQYLWKYSQRLPIKCEDLETNDDSGTMSNSKDTMKHAAVYSAAAMMGRLIGFLMLPFYAHVLHNTGYGIIGMLDMGLAFLVSLLAWGMQGAIIRLYHDEPDPTRKPAIVSTGVLIIGTVSLGLAIPIMFFAKPISSVLLDDAGLSRLLLMALWAFVFDMTGQGASAWLLIKRKSVFFATVNLMRLVLGLSLNIWLILIRDMGLDGYFISSLVTNMFSSTILVSVAIKDCGYKYDKEISLRIRKYMLPLVPGALVSFVSRQAERVLVKFQINMDSVGILEMGYKFPILLAQLITTPYMDSWNTKRFEIADEPGAPDQIGRMFTYYLFLMVFAGLAMAVVIKPVLIVLTPPEFHLSYRIARVEIVTLILQGSYYHLSFGIYYAKHTGLITKIRSVMSVLKVTLSWFFISTWGIYGAAMSAAVVGLLALILTYVLAQRRYRLILEWKKLATIVGFGIGLFLLLTRADLSGWPVFKLISESFIPWFVEGMKGTFLGTWKEGKVLELLTESTLPVTEIVIKGVISLSFGILMPFVHDGSRSKIFRFWRLRNGT